MENRFTPILLPTALYDLASGFSQMLKQFNGERGYSAEEHLGWFLDSVDLEEIDHDDVKVKPLLGKQENGRKSSHTTPF